MEERRASPFTERLSMFMLAVAATGAFFVLLDPKVTVTAWGQVLQFGGVGFSADLKGAVISAILIGGWTAVKEFWLGSSAGSEKKSDSLQRIAESVPAPKANVADAQPTNGATK